ncbi:MAG: hypothetical protein ACYC09_00055 [Bacteroidota bacterium]
MRYLPIIVFSITIYGCNDPGPLDGSSAEGYIITTDTTDYFFSTSSAREFITLTIFNNTDTTITSFGIPAPHLKTDSGWIGLYFGCGGQNVILPPRQTIKLQTIIMTDSLRQFPDGTYRMHLEIIIEGGTYGLMRFIESNEFRMRYR